MAIDARCPHCAKRYKLKDDLLGKKVTCANGACRRQFSVEPAAPEPVVDADTFAAAALRDDAPPPAAEDTRTIALTCSACDHHWAVPFAMEGKNALCPECRHRQKVPIQQASRKADWRGGASGVPSMAKVEKLDGVVDTQDTKMISGKTIRDAGMLDDLIEPRPTSFYVKIGLAAASLVFAVIFGVLYLRSTKKEQTGDSAVDELVKLIDADEIKQLPPNVGPLYRAALLLAAGEREARIPDQLHTEKAAKWLADARAELEGAPKAADRDALLAELAVTTCLLGGTDDQVKEKQKLPWVPLPPKSGRAQIKPSVYEAEGVQGQLRRVFEAMKAADFDVRCAAFRRVARELAKVDQTQMLQDTVQALFADPEQYEAKAQLGLELLRAKKPEKARELAEAMKAAATATPPPAMNPIPVSFTALALALQPELTGLPTYTAAPAAGEPSDGTRWAYTALKLATGKADEAKELAVKAGKADARLRALALGAEWADQPGPFVEAAAEVLAKAPKGAGDAPLPAAVLCRLAAAAGRANMADKAAAFAAAVPDEALREWAKAEGLRGKLQANPGAPTDADADAPVPTDAKKFKLGHAWARLALARHAAGAGRDRGLARKYKAEWPTGTIAPFGAAGVALGHQDHELRK